MTHAIKSSKEVRELFIQRLASRPGGFRIVTLRTWPPDKIAKEVVRTNAQTAADELDLLHRLYVEMEPQIQATFLDAAGVKNNAGQMPDDLEPPFADEAAVTLGVAAVRAQHGDDGERYLQTLARYNSHAWPGIVELAAQTEPTA
ncbi:MAG: hypothetical protein ABI085_03940 [Gemmatimonadaceae bacterium]